MNVPKNGYRWWYIDALSDDGQNGFTIIGFVGSVFSPYYANARKHGGAVPENHCAINIALYGSKRRWAMTERAARHVTRDPQKFQVGPSSLMWVNDELHISFNERCMPIPFALRGTVKFSPADLYDQPVMLDDAGKHYWQAVAPYGRVSVELQNPQQKWSGFAYHDMNWGDEPLENGFKNWTWQRATTLSGSRVFYNLERRDGSRMSFGRGFNKGVISECNIPQTNKLPNGFWGMKRTVNSETTPKLISTLEDAPFYTRNHVAITVDGVQVDAVHESLSLDRFVHPVVQLMLPFRMPRRA